MEIDFDVVTAIGLILGVVVLFGGLFFVFKFVASPILKVILVLASSTPVLTALFVFSPALFGLVGGSLLLIGIFVIIRVIRNRRIKKNAQNVQKTQPLKKKKG